MNVQPIIDQLRQHAEQIANELQDSYTRAEILHVLAVYASPTLIDLMKEPAPEPQEPQSDTQP